MAYRDKLRVVVLPLAIFNAAMFSTRLYLTITVVIAVGIGLLPAPKE